VGDNAGTIRIGGDLPVRRLGFGAMRLVGPGTWGPPADRPEAERVLRRAVELGVTFIDTAEAYGPEINEAMIGEVLSPYRAELVIGTKGGLAMPGPGKWGPDGRPEKIRADLEGSLRRLRLDRIDLYQLHMPDPKVPYEETVGVLADLQRAGKIRHVGVSNVSAALLAKARSIATIVSVQNRYNIADRGSNEVLDICERDGIAFLPYAPLNKTAGFEALEQTARKYGATPAQIAIAWLLRRSPVMLPIPGTSSVAHLEENLGAAAIALSDDDVAQLA
jgi:pyridoxine 4-dehydrogenase